jgi:hypothetical protein
MSWIDEPVLVHVGLQKTATSLLQESYFPVEGNGYWIPPVPSHIRHPIKQIGHWLIADTEGRLMNEADFDPVQLRKVLSAFAPPSTLVPVVSNERLAGHPLSAGFDRTLLARRIKLVFPRARILVGIRAQNSIIMSSYMQYLKYGGWHTPEMFLRPSSDARQPVLGLDFWDYDRLASVYEEIFGAENFLLLPQELLRSDAQAFFRLLADFAAVAAPRSLNSDDEANPRKPHASSYVLRRLTALSRKSSANSFVPPLISPAIDRAIEKVAKFAVDLATPKAVEARIGRSLQQRVDRMVGDYYVAGNRRLASRTSLDLSALGYRL